MIKGLYIHIPFCSIKCPYCDFYSVTIQDTDLYRKYVEALKKEIALYRGLEFQLETVYLGGGTPSLLDPFLIKDLLFFIKDQIGLYDNSEITIEVNPKTYKFEDFMILKASGINRVSIGNQSFQKKNLVVLGRDHNPEDGYKTIESCLKAGIENINLDLIYGIQNQSIEDLEKDLEIYTSLPMKHISAYLLTAYEDTQIGQLVKKGKYTLPDEETALEMFKLINLFLEKEGFKRYELSNWAREGYQCKHNMFYWTHIPFLGIGVSAWSYIDGKRTGNINNLNEYMRSVERGIKPVVYSETIDGLELKKERIFLGLRLRKGIPLSYVTGKDELISDLISEGYGFIENDRFVLTEKGLMIINRIISYLI